RELASLEITQLQARRQTLKIPTSGFSVSKFQGFRVSRSEPASGIGGTLKPGSASGNFSGSSRQILQQLADGQARLQQLNHLICTDSYLCAQRNNLGDRALQRFFLLQRERLGEITAHGCGQIQFNRHSSTPPLCTGLAWIPCPRVPEPEPGQDHRLVDMIRQSSRSAL